MAKNLEREPNISENIFVFVGEKRSNRAIELGVIWQDKKLAAKSLLEALEANGIDPQKQIFLNLFFDGEGHKMIEESAEKIKGLADDGAVIVGMGKLVQSYLEELNINHLKIIHPAARGKIRKSENYIAHIAEVLKK